MLSCFALRLDGVWMCLCFGVVLYAVRAFYLFVSVRCASVTCCLCVEQLLCDFSLVLVMFAFL